MIGSPGGYPSLQTETRLAVARLHPWAQRQERFLVLFYCRNSMQIRSPEEKFAFSRTGTILWCVVLLLSRESLLGDGCFVFRWNKDVDIREPTQKAILVYDAGREDLLIQVKYEGALEDFGWLIPVPGLPTIDQGTMGPFYELSQLTQRGFAARQAYLSSRGGTPAEPDQVRIIAVKTVGAYEVAILSGKDARSLGNWLEANGYVVPNNSRELVDEYVRKGWYFVAARIQLDPNTSFKLIPNPGHLKAQPRYRQTVQTQLSTGELHPLRISFDTARCIFPLKISAVANKSSEISLYVLSKEPLLNRFILGRKVEELHRAKIEFDGKAKQRQENARNSLRNIRLLGLSWQMYNLWTPRESGVRLARDWTLADLDAMAAQEPVGTAAFDDDYYAGQAELLQTMQVTEDRLAECAKAMERLRGSNWHLTKQVYVFRPEEMRDLEFEPAIPVLAALLKLPEGRAAAGPLYQCGSAVLPVLLSACKSTNATERINASVLLQSFKDPALATPLLTLLKDPVSRVRMNAVMATVGNWDPRFNDALFELLRDPEPRIRRQVARWLALHESEDQTPRYLRLLNEPDPDLPASALLVLTKVNPDAVPRTDLLRLLAVPRMEVISQALRLLEGPQSVLPTSPVPAVSGAAGIKRPAPDLSSLEAAPLTTNQLTLARLAGLKILYRRGDADAITLAIPLLRDQNAIVRGRACEFLQTKTSQGFTQDEPAKWEDWWRANKATFQSP